MLDDVWEYGVMDQSKEMCCCWHQRVAQSEIGRRIAGVWPKRYAPQLLQIRSEQIEVCFCGTSSCIINQQIFFASPSRLRYSQEPLHIRRYR